MYKTWSYGAPWVLGNKIISIETFLFFQLYSINALSQRIYLYCLLLSFGEFYLTTDFVCLFGGPVCSGKLCTRWMSRGHFMGVSNSGHWQPSKPLPLQQWHDPHHCSEHHNMAHVTNHNDTIPVTCVWMRFSFHPFTKPRTGWGVLRCSKLYLSSRMKPRKYIRFQRKWTKYCSLI
jgi:hypothetical protein